MRLACAAAQGSELSRVAHSDEMCVGDPKCGPQLVDTRVLLAQIRITRGDRLELDKCTQPLHVIENFSVAGVELCDHLPAEGTHDEYGREIARVRQK